MRCTLASIFDTPLLQLGEQADSIRRAKWGLDAFYVKNLHINFTNICSNQCKFCAFHRKKGEEGGYLKSVPEIVQFVKDKGANARELHIVGGLHPDVDLAYYVDMISSLHAEFPDKSIKAFGAVEMDFISRQSGVPLVKLFSTMKEAGLDMMPGGGAEIFEPSIRNIICPEKIPATRWLEVMETAHDAGILTNATMLYGHYETGEHREAHLKAIQALQERTKGFNAFIPLSFQPAGTKFTDVPPVTAVLDLAVTAASRIILADLPHIKAYWVMLGEKTAQIALRFGADDLDGTIEEENIAFAAGNKSKRGMTENDLKQMITTAGLNPVERDSFYNRIG
jgi:aminodeoxyfutalosine synthase